MRQRIELEFAWAGLLSPDDEPGTWYRPVGYVTPLGYRLQGTPYRAWAEDRVIWEPGDSRSVTRPMVFPGLERDLVLFDRVPGARTPRVVLEAEFRTSL